MNRAIITFLFCVVSLLKICGVCAAEADEILVQSRYFTVYALPGISVSSLIERIPFGPSSRFDPSMQKRDPGLKGVLAESLDVLFEEVSDALDIQVYDYHGFIRVLPNREAVINMVTSIIARSYDARAFYVHEMNTIYVSAADVTVGVLGHEIAHAIMSHYFVVPPPVKVQEILSGYVEFSLQRSNTAMSPGKKR